MISNIATIEIIKIRKSYVTRQDVLMLVKF